LYVICGFITWSFHCHRNYWCADLPVYSDSGARNGHF
jgi:hypothetical protein